MSGHRQAAMALHGLAATDRQLILAELPAEDQAILRTYLAELAALGFDSGSMPFDALLPATSALPPTDLAQTSAAAMLSVLGQEPVVLVAQVLALEHWPWRAGLMALLPPARRDAVAAVVVVPAPARDRFLRQLLTERLAHLLPAPADAGRPSWLGSMWRRGRAWR